MPLSIFRNSIHQTEKTMAKMPKSQKVMNYYTWVAHRPYKLKEIVKPDCEIIDKVHHVHTCGIDKIELYAHDVAEMYQDVFVTDFEYDEASKKAQTSWIRIKNDCGSYIGGKDTFTFDKDYNIVQVETHLDEVATTIMNDAISYGF